MPWNVGFLKGTDPNPPTGAPAATAPPPTGAPPYYYNKTKWSLIFGIIGFWMGVIVAVYQKKNFWVGSIVTITIAVSMAGIGYLIERINLNKAK